MSNDDADEMVCERHNIRELPGFVRRCPYCEEERRLEAERVHQMTRDPTVEPW